ncbi:MAG: CRISP-associated protein [Ignavibacteria bacterium]|nr:MAG: CRISP-associated protein [Ignavibacteria bacterium]
MNSFLGGLFHKQFSVKLRFKRDTTFHFYHGGKLYGLISRVINLHPIGKELIITPCETGRIFYSVGDEYNFGITVLKNDPDLIVKLLSNLHDIPESDYPGDLTNDTVELISIKELKPVTHILEKAVDDIYTFKFITPLRVERREEDQQKGKRYFDPQYFDPHQFLKLLYKRLETLARLNHTSLPFNGMPEVPSAEILEKYFMWIDMPKDNTTLGGIQGVVKLKMILDENWLIILSLGQLAHAGKNTSFGFGEYTVNESAADRVALQPVKSFMEIVLQKENLRSSFEHIKDNSDCNGVDGVTAEAFELNLEENLDKLSNEIRNGNYESGELLGIIIPKKESKIRALAIPTVRDRVLQRAVTQVLGDSIDHLLEENSFAYRKGLSRAGAARAINEAHRKGFNFVLESDIQSFFDNVNWELLFKKIEILYGADPVCSLLKQWVESDIYFEGIKIKRVKGLPQGAAISPLLANLYLDEFDEALQDDFKLIRYADDFIVLCKTKEQAEEALTAAKSSLEKLKLEIKPSKTNIVSFDDGFQYLGYLFLKTMIIEKEKDEDKKLTDKIFELNEESIPEGSWLTLIDLEKIKRVKQIPKPVIKPLNANQVDELLLEKYPLYISNNAFVHVDAKNIELTYEEEMEQKRLQFPLHTLSSVVINGNGRITMPTVLLLNENKIPVYFCRPNGALRLTIPVNETNFDIWLNQLEVSKDESFVLAFARQIVEAKINNHKVIARRQCQDENRLVEFNNLMNKALNAPSVDSLRGIEGSSAALFFETLNSSLPEEWKFDSRTKRPPEDPVNAMLSFGYTILYHHISTALQTEGLNPQISFYHVPNNRYFPLASDMQEEFRHIIDALVLYIIRRNMVSLKDFTFEENARYPCLMSYEFRKKYMQMVEERLKVLFKPLGTAKQMTYKQFITLQVRILKTGIKNRQMSYQPLRIR